MTVLAKTKTAATRFGRRRDSGPSTGSRSGGGARAAGARPGAAVEAAPPAGPGAGPAVGPATPAGRRRDAAAPQDLAIYTCQCGLVFEAAVSTSVGCPHCGDAQAW